MSLPVSSGATSSPPGHLPASSVTPLAVLAVLLVVALVALARSAPSGTFGP